MTTRQLRTRALVLSVALSAYSLSAQPAPKVTSPKEALGFNVGDDYQVANYAQLTAWWKKLATESDRMKLVDIGPTAEPLTVSYSVTGTATAGADYVTLAGSVTIPAGSIEARVTLTPLNDPDLEGLETVILTLEPGAGYTPGASSRATVTIVDDERPVVTVTTTHGAAEIGPDAGTFSVARTGPTTFPLTVFYTMAGSAGNGIDYGMVSTTLTIPAGSATATLTITPVPDTEVEGTEFVDLVLDASLGYVVGNPGIAVMALTDSVVLTLPPLSMVILKPE